MRKRLSALLVVPALAVLALAAPASASTGYHEYVALGDSWTADVFVTFPPTTEYTPLDCAQSTSDYPHELAGALGVETFRDASCGGATTTDFTQPQKLPLGGTNPPQFDRLTPTTDLVTVGVGGNDIGLAAAVTQCLNLLPVSTCKAKFTAGGVDQLENAVTATEPKIAAALQGIKERSPHARILLVNYLAGLPASGKGCWPVIPVADGDIAYLQAKFLQMNAMLARVAADNGVELVDTYSPTLGHDACQAPTVRYVEGLIPVSVSNPLLLAFPFHPNGAGAAAQSEIVLEAVQGD
ncbi:lysophospholipase L1-like esterase [Amycolatopsis lexingtonensis]|uniref:Lysophospholipase L1-like esterase n=1 Tax=Amycolatopsis lexingtonensis TaxID=218822 RepID=A0ABR9I3J3_9PSEU|nr:SGNH/GDSL hydrolase family protein [Amycolatopsis lexingtonensis]MBE1497730.1 lysophospholipase L1-like esterase [Amycolatopsis lexingtonensis]